VTTRLSTLSACFFLGLIAALPSSGALISEDALSWRRVVAAGVPKDLSALAVDAEGRLAFASAGRVALLDPERPGAAPRFVARVASVNDLVFASRRLWIAASDGLWRVDAEGRVALQSLGPTGLSGEILRVVARGPGVASAGAGGLHIHLGEGPWQALHGGLPIAAATALALCSVPADDGGSLLLFAVVGGRPWQVRARRAGDQLVQVEAQEVRVSGAAGLGAPVDVLCPQDASGQPGAGLWLYEKALAWRNGGAAPGWKTVRPSWPPDASALRITSAAGLLFVATTRGLLSAATPSSRWSRARPPAGSARVRALVESAGVVYAAGAEGLMTGLPIARSPRGRASRSSLAPLDPPIDQVQRRVLAHQGIAPSRIRSLENRVGMRAWLPELELRLGLARGRDQADDRDQSFVSGDLRRLRDHEVRHARDYEAVVSLSWNLGETVFDPEAIDVSREARSLVALRDDVLDEVNQLYFERRAILASLADAPPLDAIERSRQENRAAELAAGLDAWTGGWFSSRVAPGEDDR